MQQSAIPAPPARQCSLAVGAVLTAGLCVGVLPKSAAAAQDAPKTDPAAAILIRADKVIVRPGQVLEGASVLIENGLITAVGKIPTPPEGAREIQGKVVCAGFIDPWSVFAVDGDAAFEQRNSPAIAASDALDGYLHPRLVKDVLRSGVTSVRSQVGVFARVGGTSTALRLNPTLPLEKALLSGENALTMTLGMREGGGSSDPFERLSDVERVAGMITQGEAYALDQAEYVHELAEWKKKIADKQKELEDGFKKAKKDREKELADSKEKGKEFKEKEFKEDKAPKPPRHDAEKEVLARVAEGRIPLVVEAHRASQLRSLMDATAPFKRLRLILAGGTDALEIAPELARRRIPVIVWPQPMGSEISPEMERHDLGLAAALERAGVTVLLGSGARNGMATRDLPLLAELAVGHGLSREAAFSALTVGAARAFDLDRRLGTVEFGKEADLLLLDGEPLSGSSRVQYVISAGTVVIAPEER